MSLEVSAACLNFLFSVIDERFSGGVFRGIYGFRDTGSGFE
jgi:hypothetical protein